MIILCPICQSPNVFAKAENLFKCNECGNEWESEKRLRMVYIAHPFGGKRKNVDDAERIILKLLHAYPGTTFYSPLHATGFFYHEFPYEVGMEHCFEALRRCDALWLCEGWETSRGCKLEVECAKKHGIPIRLIVPDGENYVMEVHNV